MDNFLAVKTALRSGSRGHALEQPPAIIKQHKTILQLGNILHDKLQMKDEISETSSDSPSDEDGSSGLEDENRSTTAVSSKCLHKSATFPVSAGSEKNEPEPKLDDSNAYNRSLSMPIVRKVVSAMKGSRKKEGVVPSEKLTVSWASDVYDPPPTSVSHFPKKRNQQQYSKNHKKHGKGKQKGKNTRGGGGGSGSKEKKHSNSRKTSGKSDRCSDSYADTDRVQNYKSSLEMLDFNEAGIGGHAPDPSCGSKLLGQASGTMQCVY